METLRIRKLSARYHLPQSAEAEKERLDRILREIADRSLEAALDRAGVSVGVSDGEEICLRNLDVPVRLRLAGGDSALAAAWSTAIADAIRRLVHSSPSLGVVRYTSRIHALADMAACTAREEYPRAWAWRQMGFWCAGDSPGALEAVYELVQAFLREPSTIVPVLHALAGREFSAHLLERLAARFTAEDWVRLAQAAIEAAGGSSQMLAEADPEIAEISILAARIAADSPLARALRLPERTDGAVLQFSRADVRRALAALVLLDADPAAVRAGNRAARARLAEIADALYPSRSVTKEQVVPVPPRTRESRASEHQTDEESPIVPLRQRALTSYGGLLFLLHIVDALGLTEEILANPVLSTRTFRWLVHRLAMVLIPMADETDPAVLAFAGLRPSDPHPSRGEPPPREVELEALGDFAHRIGQSLRERLEERGSAEPLIAQVCQREAEVLADPGWIELHFSMRDVSTEIRRAGLDLDLGHVPWLGVVVRFVYD